MSRERREILEMLAEGRITAAEAERLLDAIDEGKKKRGPGSGRGPLEEKIRGKVEGLSGRIAEIVDRSVKVALKKTGRPGKHRRRRGGRETVELVDGRFPSPEGVRLMIHNNPRHPGGGSISLSRIDGEECEVSCEGPFSVYRDEDALIVEWDYGDIVVAVPDSVSRIKAWTHGGNLSVEDLRVPLDLLTHGGDLRLEGLCRTVKARALGGNVWVEIEALDPESASEIMTQHGDVFAAVGPEFTGLLKASSLSGEIQVEDGLGRVFDSGQAGMPRTAAIEIGHEPRAAEITIQTLNGNVFVERAE